MQEGSFYMATTIDTSDDYGLAIYGETGINLIGGNLLSPKLAGRLKLRQKDLGRLFVVREDGQELTADNDAHNFSLNDLRGEHARRYAYRQRTISKPRTEEEMAEVLTQADVSYRYQFSLYGNNVNRVPLLPAVIHGWGVAPKDVRKLNYADLLVKSVISGVDLEMARALKAGRQYWRQQGYNGMSQAEYAADTFDMQTGLPVTVTFRSTPIRDGAPFGFGSVTTTGGFLYIEMSPFTEMDICFYETVGIPHEYFAKCSNVLQSDAFGLVAYSYEPPLMKYAQPAVDPVEAFGRALEHTGLNFGTIVRGKYFFAPNRNTGLSGLKKGLDNEDGAARRDLAAFLEGDENAPLRYEKYNNASLRLRLMSNLGKLKKGAQVQVADAGFGNGVIYTVRAGHDYAKVHSMLQHGSFTVGHSDGGVMNAIGGATAHSAFERSFANRPQAVRPPDIADDYNGAPWNPTYTLRRADLTHLPGMDYYTPILKQSNNAALGNPSLLDEINKFIYDKTWRIQRMFNTVFKINPVVGKVPNADYSPAEALKRQEALQQYQARVEEAEALRELDGTASKAEYERIQRELSQRLGLLELIDNILDETERIHADIFPFWYGVGFRHSNDKLEMFRFRLGTTTQEPEYLPENWLMCRAPD